MFELVPEAALVEDRVGHDVGDVVDRRGGDAGLLRLDRGLAHGADEEPGQEVLDVELVGAAGAGALGGVDEAGVVAGLGMADEVGEGLPAPGAAEGHDVTVGGGPDTESEGGARLPPVDTLLGVLVGDEVTGAAVLTRGLGLKEGEVDDGRRRPWRIEA